MARTVINLNDKLMAQAKRLTHLSKKVEIVNYALEELVKRERRKGLLKLMGSGCWQGNLEEMRRSRI
ncbi:MAG: type II toxin-antitoxin system VapB family antitoxin [Candidatus Omnitrophica bacterium]|nr:type II toxin-antitoxin system VapB family antitoxin [Candidatus Omnitrophota bacterium]